MPCPRLANALPSAKPPGGVDLPCAPPQYPHEHEILFSPLLGVEALGTRVEGGVLVVEMRATVNVTALTLEQQLSKRRRLVQQMCDNIKQELKADLATDDWQVGAISP